MATSERGPSRRRRSFLQGAAGVLATASAASAGGRGLAEVHASSPRGPANTGAGPVRVRVEGQRVLVETGALSAVLDGGRLASLRSRRSGEEFLRQGGDGASPLALLYRANELVPVDPSRFGRLTVHALSDRRAEVMVEGWDGDGVIAISADPETGDLIVEPSAFSSRPGVRACRWSVTGIRPDLELVAPFFQGVKLRLEDPLVRDSRWPWPMWWEAGLAILQGPGSGFWIHTRDDRYRYKALQVGSASDPHALGLDSEAYGPIDDSLSAGGLLWRINVFEGDWTVPAGRYRDWLWQAYSLEGRERSHREWVKDVSFAVSWCPGDPAILDALALRLPPKRVLLHFPEWRTDPYDENYPTFVASEKAKAFVAKAHAMGFRVMPHFNSVDMDPSHPVYARVRDFQYRDLETKKVQGWGWFDNRVIGVPESNGTRLLHRDKKVMAKIHPGLALWRSILGGAILDAARDLSLESAFVDVTLVSHNLHNCWVEATTPTEGMKRLIDHVASLGGGLAVGGEGLNEITAQGLSFAQAHLFRSWQENADGLERTGGCALNAFLFGRLCRTIGYSGLSGRDQKEELRMRLHDEHDALPTITIDSAEEIRHPNAAVQRAIERAAGRRRESGV
jgi:hypothetical protein